MSASYSIRRAADADLDEIADYLGSRSFESGLRFLKRVREECMFLVA